MTAFEVPADEWELGYRPELDGLRGLAALLVVVAHFDTPFLLGGGAAGVLTFFVLSGFLITALLVREREVSGRIDLPAFYRRRALRLFPALALVLAITLLLAAAFGSVSHVLPQAAAAAFYVADLFPVVEPLGHAWTLSVEEQFYLVWPALLSGFALVGFGGMWVPAVAAALFVVVLLPLDWTIAAFASIALGCLVAIAATTRRLPPMRSHVAWLGLLGLTIAATIRFGAENNLSVRILAAASVVAIVACVAQGQGPSVLSWAGLRFVGRVSYGFYLWHVPVRWALDTSGFHVRISEAAPLWNAPNALIGIMLALLMAVVSYNWIEQPFLRMRHVRK